MRIKAFGNRLNARVGDDLSVLTRVPYFPLCVFAHLSNESANFRLHSVVPGKRAVAPPVEQLLYHGVPRSDRHSPLIWALSEALTDHTRGVLKLRDHWAVAECPASPIPDRWRSRCRERSDQATGVTAGRDSVHRMVRIILVVNLGKNSIKRLCNIRCARCSFLSQNPDVL